MEILSFAGIPITVGASEAVHRQRLLDEEAEAEERQEEFYLDVFCDAQSKKKNEVHDTIIVLKDGKVSQYCGYKVWHSLMRVIGSIMAQRSQNTTSSKRPRRRSSSTPIHRLLSPLPTR